MSEKTVLGGFVAGEMPEARQSSKRANLRFETAAEVYTHLPEITEDMRASPDDTQQGCVAFIRKLSQSETPEEAVTFAAYVLPRRHAVWWAHECLRHVPDLLNDRDQQMLGLAAAWVTEPNEDTRYAAMDAAMDSDSKTAGVWVALGAGWSGGSMTPPDYQPVPPPPFLTARAVNAGILSVLAHIDAKERKQALENFVQMAMVIATE